MLNPDYWWIVPIDDMQEAEKKRQRSRNRKPRGKKKDMYDLFYCTECNSVYQLATYAQRNTSFYKQDTYSTEVMPTYKLERKICEHCDGGRSGKK